jgi:hypothetical protein
MIRHPLFQLLTQKYEVFEGEDSDVPIGKAVVTDGLIQSLMLKQGATETYHGQILNRLFRSVCQDADRYNSNLSIKVAENSTRLQRFLERFNFRQNPDGIYKRVSGAMLPPSVIY